MFLIEIDKIYIITLKKHKVKKKIIIIYPIFCEN